MFWLQSPADPEFLGKRHTFPLLLVISQELPLTDTQTSFKLALWVFVLLSLSLFICI